MSQVDSPSRGSRDWTLVIFIAFTLVFAVRWWTNPQLSFSIVIGIFAWFALAVTIAVNLLKKRRHGSRHLRNGAANSN
jgi:hypothetical protein